MKEEKTLDEIVGVVSSSSFTEEQLRDMVNGLCPFEGKMINGRSLPEVCRNNHNLCPIYKECATDGPSREDLLVTLGKKLLEEYHGKEGT